MTRYAQNGGLTRFDTGSTHEQNPLSGIPIGNNNSVEENETKSGNFIYSNRIYLDSNTVSQYNLPKSLIGKSVADATKYIDDKFKGRNDKISQSTKNSMLSKVAEAQESMKPQEPEMEQPQEGMESQMPEDMMNSSQMALGGYVNKFGGGGFAQYDTFNPNAGVGYSFKPAAMTSNSPLTKPSVLADGTGTTGTGDLTGGSSTGSGISTGAGLGVATTALDLGKTAFGKPAQDTSGLAGSAPVKGGSIIAGSALKGASAGMAFGPWGAVIGGVVGAGMGIIGAGKARKAANQNSNNFAINTNNKFSDQYAHGGLIGPPKKVTKDDLINTPIVTGVNPSSQSDRFKYAIGEQGGVQHGSLGESGHYLYYGKKPGDAGFNPNVNREFVNQSGYDTYMKSPQGQQYRRNLSTQSTQPIEQLGYGGKINQMGYGGGEDPLDIYSKQFSSKLNLQPIDQIAPTFINKGDSIRNAQAIIDTPVDGDFGTNSKIALDKYRQSKGMVNIGQPLGSADYSAMGLTTDGYKINRSAFREHFPKDLNLKITSPEESFKNYTLLKNRTEVKDNRSLAGKGLSYVNKNAGNIARYAPIATNALQLSQLKKPQGERLDRLGNRYRPEYVDEAQLQNIANQTMNNSVNAIGQSGASQGQLRSSIIGSQLQRTKAISDAYTNVAAQNRATNDRAQTFNLGVDQVNLNQSNTEKDINARDQAAYRSAKREYITGIGEGIGDIGKEQVQKKIIAKTTGYRWDGTYVKDATGNIVTDPTTGKPMTEEKLKESQLVKDKKALGGYLIKNKIK